MKPCVSDFDLNETGDAIGAGDGGAAQVLKEGAAGRENRGLVNVRENRDLVFMRVDDIYCSLRENMSIDKNMSLLYYIRLLHPNLSICISHVKPYFSSASHRCLCLCLLPVTVFVFT